MSQNNGGNHAFIPTPTDYAPQPGWNPENWQCIGAAAVFGDEQSRVGWLQSSSFNTFRTMVLRLNGLLTSNELLGFAQEDLAWHPPDQPLGFASYIPIGGDARYELLYEAHRSARTMTAGAGIGKMLSTVICELQPFPEGNKRTARDVFALGAYGYNGSPADQAAYVAAVTNEEPSMKVDFVDMHDALAGTYAREIISQTMPDPPDNTYKGVKPTPHLVTSKFFPADTMRFMNELLNEPHFNEPLALHIIQSKDRHLHDFQGKDGRISAVRLLQALRPGDETTVFDADDRAKYEFIRAIIKGYAYESGPLAGVQTLTAEYWPERGLRP